VPNFVQAKSVLEDEQLYKDYVVPRRFTKPERRFRTLYADIFSHHVRVEVINRAILPLRVLTNDAKRVIEQDDVTSLFREQFIENFKIAETSNENLIDIAENLLETWKDLLEMMVAPAVAFPYNPQVGHGSNRLCLLLGDAGQGKSLLLSKVLSETVRQERSDQAKPVIVYLSMEGTWIKEDGAFKDIDATFWESLYSRLKEACIDTGVDSTLLTRIDSQALNNFELGIKRLCRELPKHGRFVVIAIDNIDRFHFSEMRYSFFTEYKSNQTTSIEKNIYQIINKFSDQEGLGKISSSIILVCRRPVYDHLLMSSDGSDPAESYLKDYSVFQVIGPSAEELLSPRLKMFAHLIDTISARVELKGNGIINAEDFTKAQSVFANATTKKVRKQLMAYRGIFLSFS
jgi:hypothetical protein